MAHHIAVVVGSLRRDSFNRQLAQAAISLAPSDFTFEFIDIASLPLYSQDYDADYPEAGKQLKQRVEAADGLLFVTPEYNRSIPGVLKNALDWGSRPWGTNSWRNKPAAVLGTGRRNRFGACAAASAQCARLSRCRDHGATRGVHQARPGGHQRKRRDRERPYTQVPADFHRPLRRLGQAAHGCVTDVPS
jgi:NAD(P)H-dependent FMN reductase